MNVPAKAEFEQIEPIEVTCGFTDDSLTEGEAVVAAEGEIVICPKPGTG